MLTIQRCVVFFALAVVASACSQFDTFSVTVIEVNCEGQWDDKNLCDGKLVRKSTLEYTVNPSTRTAAMRVAKNADDWYITSIIKKNCVAVNSKNWECTDGNESVGMYDGAYLRSMSGTFGYRVAGVTGWRYWALLAGDQNLNLSGLAK